MKPQDPLQCWGLGRRVSLTLTLSPVERETGVPLLDKSGAFVRSRRGSMILPFPEGEGLGEGEGTVGHVVDCSANNVKKGTGQRKQPGTLCQSAA